MTDTVTNLVIIGAGGHAQVVIDAVTTIGKQKILGLVDDGALRDGHNNLMGYEIKASLADFPVCSFLVAIGDNRTRKRLFEEAIEQGFCPATIVHPAAAISSFASIGEGSMVCAKAYIGVNAKVGANTIINTAATVDHGCKLGSHVHLAVGSHMTGESVVNEGVFVGSGAVINPRVEIGEWATLGAGAVALQNIAPAATAVGVPAKTIVKASYVV